MESDSNGECLREGRSGDSLVGVLAIINPMGAPALPVSARAASDGPASENLHDSGHSRGRDPAARIDPKATFTEPRARGHSAFQRRLDGKGRLLLVTEAYGCASRDPTGTPTPLAVQRRVLRSRNLYPHVIGTMTVAGLALAGVLFGFAAVLIAAGLFYGLPAAVQPMKAVSAVRLGMPLDGRHGSEAERVWNA